MTGSFLPPATDVGAFLTLAVDAEVAPGTYPLVVHGRSGDWTSSAPLNVTVTQAGPFLDVDGTWTGTVETMFGIRDLEIVIVQAGGFIEAWAVIGTSTVLNDMPGTVEGDEVTLSYTIAPDTDDFLTERFEGTVDGDVMEGTFSQIDAERGVFHEGDFTVTRE